jgi:hypothetical protein
MCCTLGKRNNVDQDEKLIEIQQSIDKLENKSSCRGGHAVELFNKSR